MLVKWINSRGKQSA